MDVEGDDELRGVSSMSTDEPQRSVVYAGASRSTGEVM